MNILITGVGGPAGRSLLKQLRDTDHTVVGVDMSMLPEEDMDAFEFVPAAADPTMINTLREIIDQYRIDMLIPTVADELPAVAEASEAGRLGNIEVVIAPLDGVRRAFDKYLTMVALDAAGVNIPDYALPSDFRGADEPFDALGDAIVVKPRVGRGSRGVRLVRRGDEDLTQLDDSHVLQTFAPGTEYSPMVHISRSNNRASVAVMEKCGSGGCHSSAVLIKRIAADLEPDVADTAVAAARALRLTGPVDLDIRRSGDGTPVVLEINARFGANSAHVSELLDNVLADHAADPETVTDTIGIDPARSEAPVS